MSTISMPTISLTVNNITHAKNSTTIVRTVNPTNPEEVLISHNGYVVAVNLRAWNMLSINAPVERIISMSDKED